MKTYRAAVIGCSRMGAFIDNETAPHPYTRPYSHAAGFSACARTELVACSDLRTEVMKVFGTQYKVPPSRQYTDYREMGDKEKLDIVSVATQPEQRAEIVVYAAEHGVRGIYAEKPMTASMREADAMVDAVERNGVAFNMGARRRWWGGFDKMKEIIGAGDLGPLRALNMHFGGPLFNTGSHILDLALWLNDDNPVAWVQGYVTNADSTIRGDTLVEDPKAHGIFQFENGVTGYAIQTPHMGRYEAVCERGIAFSLNDRSDFRLWRQDGQGGGLVDDEFPEYEQVSPTLRIIEDLVHSLDTGEPPRGGVRAARAGTELIIAFVESHLRGGARVELPLRSSRLALRRTRAPNQPRFSA